MRKFNLNPQSPIAVFDSGVGGLTVLRELKKALPSESYIYLGDNARLPYGSKSSATVIKYARECAHFLMKWEVKMLVVACNTMSSVALEILQEESPCPVVGTITPAVKSALAHSAHEKIGVIGTDATIASGAYQRCIEAALPHTTIYSKACPLFVPLVEQGMFEGEIVEKVVQLYLADLKSQNIDSLILGCTHYPLLKQAIQKFLGEGVAVIECSKAIAEIVTKFLKEDDSLRPQGGAVEQRYFVTDEVGRFNHLARLLLDGATVEAARLENLE